MKKILAIAIFTSSLTCLAFINQLTVTIGPIGTNTNAASTNVSAEAVLTFEQ